MTTIKQMLDRVTQLNRELPWELERIAKQTAYEVETLNKQQLYNYGVGNDGLRFPPYKNKYYSQEKNYMNPRPGLGQPDLFLTGSFYKGFTATVQNNIITMDSVDSKAERLKKDYGERIFGLTRDNVLVYATGVFYTELRKFVALKLS